MAKPFYCKKTDWEEEGLKGRVKELVESIYEAGEGFGVKVRSLEHRWSTRFNRQGFKTLVENLDAGGKLVSRTEYHYDGAGNLARKAVVVPDGNGGRRTDETHLFLYFENERKIEVRVSQSPAGQTGRETLLYRWVHLYDASGNKKRDSLYREGGLKSEMVYGYDAAGNRVSIVKLDHAGAVQSKTLCAYDANGNKTSMVIYDSSGRPAARMESLLDGTGAKKEDRWYERPDGPGGGAMLLSTRWVYQTDRKGNVTERASYRLAKGGGTLELCEIMEYRIAYW